MTQTESYFLPEKDYYYKPNFQTEITSHHRERQVQVLIYKQLKFELKPETLFIAVNILDRYLSLKKLSESQLGLLATTALFIASKYQEINPPTALDLSVDSRRWPVAQLLKMEYKILSLLQFDLNLPTAPTFLENYSRAIKCSDARVLIFASFLVDLFMQKEEYIKFRPSMVVCVALNLSLRFNPQPPLTMENSDQ